MSRIEPALILFEDEMLRSGAILGILLSLAGSGCSSEAPEIMAEGGATTAVSNLDSHTRMVEVLKEMREQARVEDPFSQTASIEAAERKLEELPRDADQERFLTQVELAEDYRRVGRTAEAVALFASAVKLNERARLLTQRDQEIYFQSTLGLTYLRLAETQNCIHCVAGEACILPIRSGGVHQLRTGSEQALRCFQRVLELEPENLEARWLLNIAAMTLGEYPQAVPPQHRLPAGAFEPRLAFPRFADVAAAVGVKTIDCGGGAIGEDFDNDGLLDLLTSSWSLSENMHYFRNAGDGTFIDETEKAGLKGIVGGINLFQADYDNDGLVDVFLTRGAWLGKAGRQPNSLLRNLGHGQFRDVSLDVGIGQDRFPSPTAGWADFDSDGDLDLFVGNEGPPCHLYRNDGLRGFTDIARQAGVTNDRFTKGVTWGDYDNDRYPDLYVSNLNGENRLYHNNQNGTFSDVARQLQVVQPLLSFPTWFWDVNNDGRLDLWVGSYDIGLRHVAADYFGLPHTHEPSHLYLGTADGRFQEVAASFGLTRANPPMGCNFGDLDNDGFPDFHLGTGFPDYNGLIPNLVYHNHQGTGFEEVTVESGMGHIQKGHGTIFADWDNDGDQDVFCQLGGAYPGDAFGDALYENPGFGNHFLRVKLVGTKSNRSAIGARLRADIVEGATRRSVYKWVNSGGCFGANPLMQHLGLGHARRIETLEIYWPTTDQTQRFTDIPLDVSIEVREGASTVTQLQPQSFRFQR